MKNVLFDVDKMKTNLFQSATPKSDTNLKKGRQFETRN